MAVTVEQLIPQIYEAALEPKAWNPVIEAVEEVLGGAAAALHLDFVLPEPHSLFAPSIDPVHIGSFIAHYGANNPYAPHLSSLVVDRVSWGREVVSREALEASEYYGDWMVPQRFSNRPTFVACAERTGPSGIMLGVHHREGRRDFTAQDAAFVTSLLPHLRQAGRISRRLATLGARAEVLETMIERISSAVILLDVAGRIEITNAAADALLADDDGIRDRGGELRAHDPDASRALVQAIRSAVLTGTGQGGGPGGALRLPRSAGRSPLEVIVAPLVLEAPHRKGGFAAAVFLSDPDRRATPPQATLRQLHGLTPAEAELAVRLVAGYSVDEAAEQLGITRETARTYTKRVLAKTGARRQSELVRRVLAVARLDLEAVDSDEGPEVG